MAGLSLGFAKPMAIKSSVVLASWRVLRTWLRPSCFYSRTQLADGIVGFSI